MVKKRGSKGKGKYETYRKQHRDKVHKLNRIKRWTKRIKKGPEIVARYKKYLLDKVGIIL